MANVSIRVNGRLMEVACADGQEGHVQQLSVELARKVQELVRQLGQVGDTKLLAMAALVYADELYELGGEYEGLRTRFEAQQVELQATRDALERATTGQLESAASRIETIAKRLAAS